MSMHLEYTGKTCRGVSGVRLREVRTTCDLPDHDVSIGQVGGYVASIDQIGEDAWVAQGSLVEEGATVGARTFIGSRTLLSAGATVGEDVQIQHDTFLGAGVRVGDRSTIGSDALVESGARLGRQVLLGDQTLIGSNVTIEDDVHIGDRTRVADAVRIASRASIAPSAQIYESWHVLTIEGLGPDAETVTVHRTVGDGHHASLVRGGGRTPAYARSIGTLDDLASSTTSYTSWTGSVAERLLWITQFRAVIDLGKAFVARWEHQRPRPGEAAVTSAHEAAAADVTCRIEDAARAEGVREARAYIERLFPKGLVDRSRVLADLDIAADRLSRGLHANGRDRADHAQAGETE